MKIRPSLLIAAMVACGKDDGVNHLLNQDQQLWKEGLEIALKQFSELSKKDAYQLGDKEVSEGVRRARIAAAGSVLRDDHARYVAEILVERYCQMLFTHRSSELAKEG